MDASKAKRWKKTHREKRIILWNQCQQNQCNFFLLRNGDFFLFVSFSLCLHSLIQCRLKFSKVIPFGHKHTTKNFFFMQKTIFLSQLLQTNVCKQDFFFDDSKSQVFNLNASYSFVWCYPFLQNGKGKTGERKIWISWLKSK